MIKLDYTEEYPKHIVEYCYNDEIICEITEPTIWPDKGEVACFDDKEYFVCDVKYYPVTQKAVIFLSNH
mgnify:CR=1 FL=1